MYVGWRELRWAKGRFAMIGGVITLITVLIGLLSGLTLGLSHESTSAVTGLRADHLVLSGSTFDSSQVPADLVPGATPLGLSTTRASGAAGAGAVQVIGVPPGSTVAPDADGVQDGSVVLSEGASELLGASGVRIGATTYDVAAVRGDASYAHLPVVWLTLADWQDLTHSEGAATALALTGPAVEAPPGYSVLSIDESLSAIGSYSAENGSLVMIRGFLVAISALVIGAFFTVWMYQRSGDVAVLKALGATTASLLTDALGQAAALLLGATLLGTAITLALAPLATAAVPFVVDPMTLVTQLGLLIGSGLLGAAFAVRRVTAVDPLIALSGR